MTTPISLFGLGGQGLVTGIPREQLDLRQAWLMQSVRAFRGKLQAAPGATALIAGLATGRVLAIQGWEMDDGSLRLNVVTEQKIYRLNEAAALLTDITRASGNYTGNVYQLWDTGAFQNLFLATNELDNIQKWDGAAANCVNLGGAPPRCGALSGFLTYLVLADLVTDRSKVQWSDSGNAEAWSGGDANFFRIYQGPGKVLRMLPIGDVLLLYRTSSIHMIFYVGPPFILGQRQLTISHGLVAKRAVVPILDQHLYWGTDNFYRTDGATRTPIGTPIIDDAIRSYEPQYRDQIHAAVDFQDHEVYWFYPPVGSTDGVCTRAWAFNYLTGSWRQEFLRASASGSWRRIVGAQTWQSIVGTWAAQTQTWAQTSSANQSPLIALGTDAGAIRFIDNTTVDEVGSGRARVAETGLFAPADLLAERGERGFRKGGYAELVRFDVDQENKGTWSLEVWIGTQNVLTGDPGITWTQYTLPASGATAFLRPRLRSRWFALRFRTSGAGESFAVSGGTAHFAPGGDR